MKKVIILVGNIASGKSTLAKRIEQLGFVRLNADSIREELYGDSQEQGDYMEVFGILYDRLQIAQLENKNVVVDNTNLRLDYLNQLRLHVALWDNYVSEVWFMNTPLQTCLERNAKRLRQVPEEIILMYQARLEEIKDVILDQATRVISPNLKIEEVLEEWLYVGDV